MLGVWRSIDYGDSLLSAPLPESGEWGRNDNGCKCGSSDGVWDVVAFLTPCSDTSKTWGQPCHIFPTSNSSHIFPFTFSSPLSSSVLGHPNMTSGWYGMVYWQSGSHAAGGLAVDREGGRKVVKCTHQESQGYKIIFKCGGDLHVCWQREKSL